MATTSSMATMAAPISAVVLRRRRRTAWANGDSARGTDAGQGPRCTAGNSAGVGRSAPVGLPPLMGGRFIRRGLWLSAMIASGVPDPRIQEGVGQVDEQVDDDERQGGEQREALHLLVIAG